MAAEQYWVRDWLEERGETAAAFDPAGRILTATSGFQALYRHLPRFESARAKDLFRFQQGGLGQAGRWPLLLQLEGGLQRPAEGEVRPGQGSGQQKACWLILHPAAAAETPLPALEAPPFWKEVLGRMPEGGLFILDQELRFVYGDGEILRQFNFFELKMRGLALRDLLAYDWAETLETHCREALAGGSSLRMEIEACGGEHFEISSMAFAQGGFRGVLCFFRNITALRKAEAERKKNLLTAMALIEHLPDSSLVIFDLELRYQLAGGEELDRVNLSREELLGKTIFELFDPPVHDFLAAQYRKALAGQKSVEETTHNGSSYRVHTFPLRDESGQVFAGAALTTNITPLRRTEARLSETRLRRLRLEQEAQQREQEMQELNAYAHTVAHDLKSPLLSLQGLIDLIFSEESGSDLPSQRRYARAAYATAGKMGRIIDELLLLAQRSAEEGPALPADMNEAAREALSRFEFLIAQQGARVELMPDMPMALGRQGWIEEIWANFISNALKHGGRPPEILLGWDMASPDRVRYWVRDRGQGISPAEQQRLFKPFSRLRPGESEGQGLGLSIVKRIVERLGAEVGLESEPGKGSLFFFILPAAQAASFVSASGD